MVPAALGAFPSHPATALYGFVLNLNGRGGVQGFSPGAFPDGIAMCGQDLTHAVKMGAPPAGANAGGDCARPGAGVAHLKPHEARPLKGSGNSLRNQ